MACLDRRQVTRIGRVHRYEVSTCDADGNLGSGGEHAPPGGIHHLDFDMQQTRATVVAKLQVVGGAGRG